MSTSELTDEVFHRMELERIAMREVAAMAVSSPDQAQRLGEAARTAIDALLGDKVSDEYTKADGTQRVSLTEGDAQADLNGTRRPDNHID